MKHHRCPNCGKPVGWQRLFFKAGLWAEWKCPRCGRFLQFDSGRLFLAALVSGSVIGLSGLAIGTSDSFLWWILLVSLATLPLFVAIEGVRLLEKTETPPNARASNGNRSQMTRQDILQILLEWQNKEITAEEVHSWADRNFPGDLEYDDWEGADDVSVANEILEDLSMLDMNLMIVEDIPIYLEFLSTPIGAFSQGYERFQNQLNKIDFTERSATLRGHPLYRQFCGG